LTSFGAVASIARRTGHDRLPASYETNDSTFRVGELLRASLIGGFAAGLLCVGHLGAQTLDNDGQASDSPHPGHAVYQRSCGGCHDNSQATRAPPLESLRALSRATVEYATTIGYMRIQARDLTPDERTQLLDWLSMNQPSNDAWIAAARCSNRDARIDPEAPPIAASFGLGLRNLRHMTAAQSGLSTSDFAKLELAWAFAFPQTPTMRSQPVVAGDTLFVVAADAGRLFALSTESGCLKWHYESSVPLRSSLSYGEIDKGRPVIVAGDAVGNVLALDALTGEQLWRTDVRLHESNRITGTPVIHDGRVFAPLSAVEINYAIDDFYECCHAQGAVIALDLKTGRQLWTGRTMPPATKQKLNRAGAQLWGPSGAPIWTTPAIDAKRNVLYVGTGENNSLPATQTSDAIIAFDLDTGERKWVFQATARDVWNYACRNGANCDFGDEAVVLDHDFGGSVMITQRKDGRDLLVVGQKSGTVWALDPDEGGALVWSRRIGRGSMLGGIHWGTATDGARVFAPLNDRGGPTPEYPLGGPGLHALDLETGTVLWSRKAEPDCSGDRKQRYDGCETRLGYSPAPLVVDGAVIQGSIDGILRVFDAATGATLWSYDTIRKFETVNGVAGQGGSLDAAPYVAAHGALFVVSGYSRFAQTPGNVLLAFRPKR
jgi:polyvinyl alcohol dehydrogenase (cytochrome)